MSFFYMLLGEAAKKITITVFGTFLKFGCHLKINIYFLSKYGNITLKFVGRYFNWVVTIFSKKRLFLSQNWGKKKNCQNPFTAI